MKRNIRLRPGTGNRNPASAVFKTLFVMYLITAVMLVILAFLLYQLDLSEAVVKIGTIVVYVASGFVGGAVIGRQMQQKKYLWGLLAGGSYFLILLFLSLLIKRGMGMELTADPVRILATFVLCAVSGMAGGMFS